MEKYYLFGAGNNAWGVISFFGKENILAIVDNEIKKAGQKMMDIPVISFEQYLQKRSDNTIIITAAVYETIENQLREAGIVNYYIAPMIQMGMASVEQMIDEWHLIQKDKIILFGYNPIGRKIVREMLKHQYSGQLEVILQKEIERKWADEDDLIITHLEQIVPKETVIAFSSDDAAFLREKSKINIEIFHIFDLVMESNKSSISKLKKWKNVHKGEECFIVGNGPSLRMEDLEKIHRSGIASFGMNLIYKIFENTSWRPTYYVFSDYNMMRQYYDEIRMLPRENLFIKNFYYMDDTPQMEDANYYPGYGERCYLEKQLFSKDISQAVYGGYSVMYDALQIAIYMGYQKIYLLGADFSYLGDPAQKGNHFYDNKAEDKRLIAGKPHIYITLEAMRKAKEYGQNHGVAIYNATRGGKLEVFPRIDFDKLIGR